MKPVEVIDAIIRGEVMSLDELQNGAGITQGMLIEWLHGRGEPDEEQKQAICRVLGIPSDLFIRLERIPVPSDLPPRQWDCLVKHLQ